MLPALSYASAIAPDTSTDASLAQTSTQHPECTTLQDALVAHHVRASELSSLALGRGYCAQPIQASKEAR